MYDMICSMETSAQSIAPEKSRGNLLIGIFISLLCLGLAYVILGNLGLATIIIDNIRIFSLLGFTSLGLHIFAVILFVILNTSLLFLFKEKELTKRGLRWGYGLSVIIIIIFALATFKTCC